MGGGGGVLDVLWVGDVGADLSDPPGSDSPGRASDQTVRSVGRSAGGGGCVVS